MYVFTDFAEECYLDIEIKLNWIVPMVTRTAVLITCSFSDTFNSTGQGTMDFIFTEYGGLFFMSKLVANSQNIPRVTHIYIKKH